MFGPLGRVSAGLARLLDVRPGEGRAAAFSFVVLLLLIAAHTILETARDALLLAKLPPRSLAIVYLVIAALTLPVIAVCTRLVARVGARRALLTTLVASVGGLVGLFLIPVSRVSILAFYVATGLIGALLVPQFWALVGRLFTVTQGRRLLGLIAAAGLLGGLFGSATAAGALAFVSVHSLIIVGAVVFVAAGAVVATGGRDEPTAAEPSGRSPTRARLNAFREEPFLTRIAILVCLATASLLLVDYLFKSTVARAVPADQLGHFFARYYAVLNGISLLVQLLVGRAIVSRLGVATAVAVTPLLLLLGSIGTLLAGGALAVVLLLKGVDGSLRHSIHRITTELVYLPVPRAAREQAKPLIDGALGRGAQAITAGALLVLGEARLLSPVVLAAVAGGLALAWFVAAATIRRPYLALFRRNLSAGAVDTGGGPDDIDLTSAEALVERLASRDPAQVIAAMQLLARRGRDRLIPALVLYHRDEGVLEEALGIFDASSRSDWMDLAEPLLDHPHEGVRLAAVEALGNHGRLELLERLVDDKSARVRGYVIGHLALREPRAELLDDPRVAYLLDADGEGADDSRLGLLSAIVQARPTPRLRGVLVAFARDAKLMGSPDYDEPLARAAARHRDVLMIPLLVERLPRRQGREAIRAALLSMGPPAFREVWEALRDTQRDRRLRTHLPRTLARFGTQQAVDQLLELLETEADGVVRYKAIRGLGQLIGNRFIRVDRRRTEQLAHRHLVEHFRILGLRVALDVASPAMTPEDPRRAAATGRLLAGLLDDKLRQSLERVFRLLKIANRREDFRGIFAATQSRDRRARANASEFIDTLLRYRDQHPLRELLRVVTDDLDAPERAQRAAALLERADPKSRAEALLALINDPDATVATIAAAHAAAIGDETFRAAVSQARETRPALAEWLARLFEIPTHSKEPAHAGG